MASRVVSIRCSVRSLAVFALAIALLGGAAGALPASQQLTVKANVLKRASLTVLSQPASLVITLADIQRGYVDIPSSALVSIRNNSREGFLLEFASEGDFIRSIHVSGLANDVQMGPAGGLIAQPGFTSRPASTTVALGFRFVLSDGARPGTYAWPMRLSVAPM